MLALNLAAAKQESGTRQVPGCGAKHKAVNQMAGPVDRADLACRILLAVQFVGQCPTETRDANPCDYSAAGTHFVSCLFLTHGAESKRFRLNRT